MAIPGAPASAPQQELASPSMKLRYAAEYLGFFGFLTLMAFETRNQLHG